MTVGQVNASNCRLPAIVRGDDYAVTFRFFTDATKAEGVDLSGRDYTAQARTLPNDAEPAVTFTVDDADAGTGELVLRVGHDETADLLEARGGRSLWWDLQEDADGIITTLLAGRVSVKKDVTR